MGGMRNSERISQEWTPPVSELTSLHDQGPGFSPSLTHLITPAFIPGEEAGQLEVLEGQWRAALNKYRHKKKQVRQLGEDLQVHKHHAHVP